MGRRKFFIYRESLLLEKCIEILTLELQLTYALRLPRCSRTYNAIYFTSVNTKPYVEPDYSSKLNITKPRGHLQNSRK